MNVSEKQPATDAIIGCDYVFPSEILTETLIGLSKISETLVIGKTWKPIYFTPGSAVLTTDEKLEDQGRIFESKFELKTPGGSADLTGEFNKFCGRAIVLKLTFAGGGILICGGKTRKLRLMDGGTYGTTKGHILSFAYQSKTNFKWIN
jgi:hypothetical protein